jgi:aminoglycoside phosphotransferase (APT) family kinase protein
MASDLNEASLCAWLSSNLEGFSGPMSVEKFPNGQSNPTYRLQTPARAYVLRRKPFGALLPSAHAIEREFRVLSALHPAGFPTPAPMVLCEDPSIIGAAFYIMGMVEGRALRDQTLPESTPTERNAVYKNLIRTLGALHSIDYTAVGLGEFGRPGNFFERQVARWIKQYRASQTEEIPALERVIEWLPATAPPQEGNAIVHGDYRLENVLFAPAGPEVAAVLDWELATIGDPLADLTYLLMPWVMPPEEPSSIATVDFAASGIPTIEEAIGHYCAATGRRSLPDLHWYFSYNLFRLAGILQGVKKRIIEGNASGTNAEEVTRYIPVLAEAAWRQAQHAGARQ